MDEKNNVMVSGSTQQNTSLQPKSEIQTSIDILKDGIVSLEGKINILFQKLNPILSAENPVENNQQEDRLSESTEIGEILQGLTDRTNKLNNNLKDLLDRIKI